jgi:putative transposase
MPRLPRLSLGGQVHHVIQRGHNRQAIVHDDEDRRRFLALLKDCSLQYRVAIHAYALMDNHLHLLATPETAEGLSQMMQALGRRYVAAFNQRHGRSGTLWEGRFRAAMIDAEQHLLACMRYVELNPVRAGVVDRPEAFAWSSAAQHLGKAQDPLVSDHKLIWSLGNTPFEREAAYRDYLEQGAPPDEVRQITQSTLRGWPWGSPAFLQAVSQSMERPVVPKPRGRPRRIEKALI